MRKPISPQHRKELERLVQRLTTTVHERGIKRKWLAYKVGISEDAANKILRGKTPSLGTLMAMGDVLGLDLLMEWRER